MDWGAMPGVIGLACAYAAAASGFDYYRSRQRRLAAPATRRSVPAAPPAVPEAADLPLDKTA